MSKKIVKSISNTLTLALALVIFMMSSAPSIAYAKTVHAPYGFTYDDSASNRTIYAFYTYSEKGKTYVKSRSFYSKSKSVYTSAGVYLSDTMSSGALYNGFGLTGDFYTITPTTALAKVDSKNRITIVMESGSLGLLYNSDDLAIKVRSTDGIYDLKTLKPVPETDDNTDDVDNTPKSPNRVESYVNSLGEFTYEAYKNNKLKTQLVISKSGNKVLNATKGIVLSECLKGAKFIGFDNSYNIYLYESDTLYRFVDGKWYSAERLVLDGTYKKFIPDENGFIKSVIIQESNGEKVLGIKQLTVAGKWKSKKTHAVKKSDYITLYIKGNSKSYTLSKSKSKGKSYLKINGTKLEGSRNAEKYGFTIYSQAYYVKNGNFYIANYNNPYKVKKIFSNVKYVHINKVNLAYKVTLKDGTVKKINKIRIADKTHNDLDDIGWLIDWNDLKPI